METKTGSITNVGTFGGRYAEKEKESRQEIACRLRSQTGDNNVRPWGHTIGKPMIYDVAVVPQDANSFRS